tara:strand:- start:149 stop:754 length:606 start_codon:yes stop_codon:yes gene_type:complete
MNKIILALIIFLFSTSLLAESLGDWSGLYLGVYESEDKLSANATSTSWPDDPYATSTDKDKNNLGIFLGYNYSINDIIIGVETSFQDNIGEDKAIPALDGSVVYDDMVEYKLKIGYSFNRYLAYSFFGSGDLNVYWSGYTNEDTSTHNYETKGIGLSAKITNNTFVGLSFSETNLDLYYPDTDYLEAVQLNSFRLRFGYLF